MPQGQIYKKFAELIKRLAKEYGGPVFQPHVTLLGETLFPEKEVINRTGQLISSQKPFQINLAEIGYEDYHFRALFVKAVITKPLLALHERAKKLFGMENSLPYMPHLSLLYGNYPAEMKEKIIAEIGKEQLSQFEISSVFLKRGGEVKDWKTIKEFPFQ